MRTQVFTIRLDALFLHQDQIELDAFLAQNEIVKTECAYVASENYWTVLLFYEQSKVSKYVRETKTEKYSIKDEELNMDENIVFQNLIKWRILQAKEENLPPYFIESNNELKSVSKMKPHTENELSQIKGFGRYKIENYGKDILKIVNEL